MNSTKVQNPLRNSQKQALDADNLHQLPEVATTVCVVLYHGICSCILRMRCPGVVGRYACVSCWFYASCTSSSSLKQHSTKQFPFRSLLPFVGPDSARKRLVVSSNSFAYRFFHAITFERKVFSKLHNINA